MKLFDARVRLKFTNEGVYVTPSLAMPIAAYAAFIATAACLWFVHSQVILLPLLESAAIWQWSEQPIPRGPLPKVPWYAVFGQQRTWNWFSFLVIAPAIVLPVVYGLKFHWFAFIPQASGSASFGTSALIPFAVDTVGKDRVSLVLTDVYSSASKLGRGNGTFLVLKIGRKVVPLLLAGSTEELKRRASQELSGFCDKTGLKLPEW